MSQPLPPPAPTVIEWGAERRRAPGRLLWRHPRVAWVPAGLGAAAMFGTLVGEWQTLVLSEFAAELDSAAGVLALGPLGTGWVLAGMLVVACLALTLVGQPVARPVARSIGLVLVGVQLGLAVAVTLQLDAPVAYRSIGLDLSQSLGEEIEIGWGRGLYLAYAAVALLAVALWLARPAVGAGQPAEGGGDSARNDQPWAGAAGRPDPAAEAPVGGTGELTVGPAEPFADPSAQDKWR